MYDLIQREYNNPQSVFDMPFEDMALILPKFVQENTERKIIKQYDIMQTKNIFGGEILTYEQFRSVALGIVNNDIPKEQPIELDRNEILERSMNILDNVDSMKKRRIELG